MVEIKNKIIDFIKKTGILDKIKYHSFIFYFLSKINEKPCKFKININTKCLVLSPYPGAETKGLGGLIAQYPKNFEILCFTNGSNMLKEFDTIKSASIKKQQFSDVMKSLRVKGFKIFDIDSETLKNHYSTFRKIDTVSKAVYQKGQFLGVGTNLFKSYPTKKERELSKACLDYWTKWPATRSLYFKNPGKGKACPSRFWGPFVGKYKNHCFYRPDSNLKCGL